MSISVTVSGEDSTSVILSSVLTESVSISEDSSVDVVASSGNSATITVSSGDPISITGNYSNFVTGQVVRPPEITDFLTENQINTKITTATGDYNTSATNVFYPKSNPSGFITGVDLSELEAATGNLDTRVNSNTANIVTANENIGTVGLSVDVNTSAIATNAANIVAANENIESNTSSIEDNSDAIADNADNINNLTGVTGSFITNSETGLFYASSNPSGFITGIDLSPYTTEDFVTGVSGFLQSQISSNYSDITGIINTTGSFVLKSETGSFISDSETGQFYSKSNPSGFITGVDLSSYVQSSETGVLYPTSNPSGFITGVDLSSYIQDFETGAFYPTSNPSGFITGGGGGDVSTGINVTGLSTVGKITLSEFSFEVETGSFSLGSTHNGATVLLQNTTPITITVPSQVSGYTVTFIAETINSVAFASGVGLSGFNSFNSANRIAGIYGQAQIIFKSSDYAFLGGNVV